MRFISRNDHIDYVVQPSEILYDASGRRRPGVTPTLTAEFRGHLFDSEWQARKHNWSPEQKVAVENYLQAHGDISGGGLFVEGRAPESLTMSAKERERGLSCVVTTTAPDGSTIMCGKRPVIREDMCAEHVAQFLPAEASDPDQQPGEEFTCEVCGKGFAKEQGLRMHTMRAHPKEGAQRDDPEPSVYSDSVG